MFIRLAHVLAFIWTFLRTRTADLILINPAKGEIIAGLQTFLWGVWLLWVDDFASIPQRRYTLMSEIGDATYWGSGLVALGVLQAVALLWNHNFLRRFAALWMLVLWSFAGTTFCMYSQGGQEFGMICLVQAISCAWTYFQIGWKMTTTGR